MFGTEEIEEIQPAIDAALEEGIHIPEKKPTPPDSIFSKYNKEQKKWDAVSGVNVTLGIPIIRVSVDHGTGFDLAGTGKCNELSLVNSIDYAIRLAENK